MSNTKKKIMLLGGIHYLLPVIKAAHEQGYYVITADYLPDNVAHKYSDEYVNVSIINKEAVLKVSREKEIDGIISFGVDPGVVTAAYVQEQMGLPSMGPYESVRILQNKDLFRAFLANNGFNTPKSQGFSNKEDALHCQWVIESLALSEAFWGKGAEGGKGASLIVKPTDSAGSKGVTKVSQMDELEAAVDEAFAKSIGGHIIIEEFLQQDGFSTDTDSFVLDGKFVFVSYNSQRFDVRAANPYTPSAYTWPSTYTEEQELYLTNELQRLFNLLHMKTSVYNIETRVSKGRPYIMEASPRGGGNRLCEMLRYATGVDLITAQVRAAVGDPIESKIKNQKSPIPVYNGHWAEIILHAEKDGIYDGIDISSSLPAEVVEEDLWVKPGDKVEAFNGANNAIGTLVLRFEDKEQMEYAVTHQSEWLTIRVK